MGFGIPGFRGLDSELLLQAARVCGPYCRSSLSEFKKAQNGVSLAMYPLVGFASQALGYVNKERRFLSDAPFRRFFESQARRLPKISGGNFPSVSF